MLGKLEASNASLAPAALQVTSVDSQSVTVIIPTYNRASLIGQTIENMLAQSLKPHEVLVVDDGSTDNTREVVASFGPRVRYLHQRNQGPAAARNAGFAAATGAYVQFMDSDDLASLNKLEAQVDALQREGGDMAYCPWIQLRIDGQTASDLGHVLQVGPVPEDYPLYEWHLRNWALVLQNCLFTRAFLAGVGSFRQDLVMTEDTEFLNRVFLAVPKVAFTPECLVLYRVHDSNKLTQAGTSSSHKAVHWARAQRYMLENLRASGKSVSATTRFRIAHQAWRIRLQLSASGESAGNDESLRDARGGYPDFAHSLFSLWMRLLTAVRARLWGARWPNSFRARIVRPQEIRLIEALGLRIEDRAA